MQVFKGTDGTGKTETSAGLSGVSRIGWTNWGACRTLVKFNEEFLSDNDIIHPDQINVAIFEFRDLMAQSQFTMIACHQFNGSSTWSESDTETWNELGASQVGDLVGKANVSAKTGNTPSAIFGNSSPDTWDLWHRFNLTSVVKTWMQNNAKLEKGLIFKADTAILESSSSASNMKTFSSMQGNASYKPYFYINYDVWNHLIPKGNYYINNKGSGDYLRFSNFSLTAKSGKISALIGIKIRWKIIPIDKDNYIICPESDLTKCLAVPTSSASSTFEIITLTDTAVDERCKWSISIASGGGCLFQSVFNKKYLYSNGNSVNTSSLIGEIGSTTYLARVWRLGDGEKTSSKNTSLKYSISNCFFSRTYDYT